MTDVFSDAGDHPNLQERVWLEQCSDGHRMVQWVTTAGRVTVCPVCEARRAMESPGPQPTVREWTGDAAAGYREDLSKLTSQSYWEDCLHDGPNQAVLYALSRAIYLAYDCQSQGLNESAAQMLRVAAKEIKKQQSDTSNTSKDERDE